MDLKVHYSVYKNLLMVPNQSQINLSTPSYLISLKFVSILSCHIHIGLPSSLFRCSDKYFMHFSLLPWYVIRILYLSCFKHPNIRNAMQPSQCKLPSHPGGRVSWPSCPASLLKFGFPVPSTSLQANKSQTVLLVTWFHAGFLLGLFFDPKYGSDMFFWNVSWLPMDYMALYQRR
jgi:hypothetical protein